MSKSFALTNGDLSIGEGRSFQIVKGREKLGQDLRLWVLERIGTDPSTPDFGSTLDGGKVNGQPVQSFIGQMISPTTLAAIRQDITNLVTRYQALQYSKIRTETTRYLGSTTIDQDEAIASINSIDVRASGTTVIVQINLTTVANSSLRLTFPIGV
jgi:hypothetical protein